MSNFWLHTGRYGPDALVAWQRLLAKSCGVDLERMEGWATERVWRMRLGTRDLHPHVAPKPWRAMAEQRIVYALLKAPLYRREEMEEALRGVNVRKLMRALEQHTSGSWAWVRVGKIHAYEITRAVIADLSARQPPKITGRMSKFARGGW